MSEIPIKDVTPVNIHEKYDGVAAKQHAGKL